MTFPNPDGSYPMNLTIEQQSELGMTPGQYRRDKLVQARIADEVQRDDLVPRCDCPLCGYRTIHPAKYCPMCARRKPAGG